MTSNVNMKQAMGWQHPNKRDCCANCAYIQEREPEQGFCKPAWYCIKGDFFTPPYAVCQQFEKRP